MADERKLQFVDFLILDTMKRTGHIHDAAMARQLHCPRIFLLARLEWLIETGYLALEEEGYVLTERGHAVWIPLDNYRIAEKRPDWESEIFDWTEIYIPEPGWLEE